MLLLAFDTSTSKGGVAISEDGKILSSLTWEREGSHAELLTPAIETCLAQAGRSLKEIDALAIGNGPGSFTGVRIAVNAARTLAYSLGKSIYVFDTSELIAENCGRHELPLVVVINAHKNLVFVSTFINQNGWVRKLPLQAMSLEQLNSALTKKHICVGDGFAEFASVMPAELSSRLVRDSSWSDEPSPIALALFAHREAINPLGRKPLVWKDVQALYIRASGAEEKHAEKLAEKLAEKTAGDRDKKV
jgi:tRNA threonylcarbamoyladenosine biosynthesis protein TsaB